MECFRKIKVYLYSIGYIAQRQVVGIHNVHCFDCHHFALQLEMLYRPFLWSISFVHLYLVGVPKKKFDHNAQRQVVGIHNVHCFDCHHFALQLTRAAVRRGGFICDGFSIRHKVVDQSIPDVHFPFLP